MSAAQMKNTNKVVPITAGRRQIQPVLTPHLRVPRAPLSVKVSLEWLLGVAAVRYSASSAPALGAPAAPVDIGEHRAKKRQDRFGSQQPGENRGQ